MLSKHELPVAREEAERVDTLRYSWQKLQTLSAEVSTGLIEIQPDFRTELIENVKQFAHECNKFYTEYEEVCLVFLLLSNNYICVNLS